MELSIIQHAKDKAPRQVTVDELVSQMRSASWPAGYQPLVVAGAVVEGGLQKKNVRWLTGLAVVKLRIKREELRIKREELRGKMEDVRDDLHTRLCWTDQSGGMFVVFEYELNDGFGKEQQIRYYGKVQHFGMEYYARLTGCEADRTLVGVTKPVPLCHAPDVYYNPTSMPFMSADIAGKGKNSEGVRERISNWEEKVMTLDEIDDHLNRLVELRRNLITDRLEIRWLCDDIPRGLEPWTDFTDYEFSKLWRRLQRIKPVNEKHLQREIGSDFTPDFHPFRDYLDHLPPWNGETDHIAILAAGVTVAGGEKEQQSFCGCLKRWLVAMIAGWLSEDVINQTVLVFVGRQGIYKTTWFNSLLPPQLRRYFFTRPNVKKSDKDSYTAMTQYGLICCEELDSMTKGEMNSLKADITTAFFNYRKPYDRYTENHKHIASFCATGNHMKFLNDPTGTRRWLPFRVESILSPRDFPFDHDSIFAQAYTLYQEGYAYYFSEVEIEWLNERNKGFTVPNLEQQLVYRYFRKPVGEEQKEHVDAAMALQVISGNIASKLYPDQVDAAFAALGFEEATIDGMPGYLAVRRKPEEVNALGRLMVLDAAEQKKT